MSQRVKRTLAVFAVVLALAVGGWAVWRTPSVQMAYFSRLQLSQLEAQVADNPNDWRLQYWFGKRALESGDVIRAEPALRAAAGTAPNYLPALTELGKLLLAKGQVEESFQ